MIATVQDIASEPGEEASLKTANYPDAVTFFSSKVFSVAVESILRPAQF